MTTKPGYLTFRSYVYLGRVRNSVRERARRAGLVSIDKRTMRNMIQNSFAGSRMLYEGVWHDTVRY